MIYKNEADFRYGTKWQNTVPWVIPAYRFDFATKLFSVYPSQILRDISSELLNTRNIFIDSPCSAVYPGSRGKFLAKYQIWYISVDSSVYFFWTLQIPFVVHNTTHGSYIKVTIFICGWCQAICSKLKYQMREFPLCFRNIPNFWPVVYIVTTYSHTLSPSPCPHSLSPSISPHLSPYIYAYKYIYIYSYSLLQKDHGIKTWSE